MPKKPMKLRRRWEPEQLEGRKPSMNINVAGLAGGLLGGVAGGAAGATPPPTPPPPEPPIDPSMPPVADGTVTGVPDMDPTGMNGPYNASPANLANAGTPATNGGFAGAMPSAPGRSRFTMGNPANGNLDFGPLVRPRPNPNFDPNNPEKAQPFKDAGFFRRLIGDNSSDLNAQYSAQAQQSLAQTRWAQQQQAAKIAQMREEYKLKGGLQSQELEARKQQQAADWQNRIGLANAEAQIRASQANQSINAQQNFARQQEEERASRELFGKYGTYDPILQNARADQGYQQGAAANEAALAGAKQQLTRPVFGAGGQFTVPGDDGWKIFHNTPPSKGGPMMDAEGNYSIMPPSDGETVQTYPPQPKPQPTNPRGISADDIVSKLGVTAAPTSGTQPAPTQTTPTPMAPEPEPTEVGGIGLPGLNKGGSALAKLAEMFKRNMQRQTGMAQPPLR